jgi:hypothetical protein
LRNTDAKLNKLLYLLGAPKLAEQLSGAMSNYVRELGEKFKKNLSFRFEDMETQKVQLLSRLF